ncbi:MAG: tRNA pseudouridine(38-40) synthase TruA [Rhodobacterales bacterium]|jgi:tRNA pseudouridine38-40 synthase|nr:tRNA pseudouridine(38-40) synthase TruA [Pseudomonadota bacterium]MDA1287053.1 tRNA pseudouridine(38-40) synthase TruA [Pseudomonadota bacterium]NQW12885.1 tRNA pseudouridine(38-40) synthase TruA [Rhodobacter sp.]
MPIYALKIEYHGGPFAGWQRQKDQPSVQQTLEQALRKLDPDMPSIAAAGRTDAGVHATGQVAHCQLAKDWDPFRLSEALNFHLRPAPIAIVSATRAPDDFHARFSAIERRYLFRLITRRAPLVHQAGLAWHISHDLDLTAMQAAARHLIGLHDFTTFRATHCQAKSPIKTLDMLNITAQPYASGTEFQFTLSARSFLHNQVRSIVGTLERVGAGAWHPDRVKTVLQAQDRTACGPVCPPQGLYLTGVGYPKDPFAQTS